MGRSTPEPAQKQNARSEPAAAGCEHARTHGFDVEFHQYLSDCPHAARILRITTFFPIAAESVDIRVRDWRARPERERAADGRASRCGFSCGVFPLPSVAV